MKQRINYLLAGALIVLIAAVLGGLWWWGGAISQAVIWLAAVNQWIADNVIQRLGYAGVFGLMFIESTFIPFPSEVIIPPAADLARRLPDWNLIPVIVLGWTGSLAGALFNYTLALYLGRPLLLGLIARYGRYAHLSPAGYGKAEAFFLRHGAISTFTGRLLPGIRQLISLPAGLARMNLLAFTLLTSLGAGIWVVMLALMGYWFGGNAEALAEAMSGYSRWMALGVAILIAGYVLFRRHAAKRTRQSPVNGAAP